MATVSVSTTPTQLDAGTAAEVLVEVVGSEDVYVVRADGLTTKLRPGVKQAFQPEGLALTAKTQSGTSSVITTATATVQKGTYAPLDARDTSITSFTVGMLVSSGSSIYRVTTAHAAPFDSTKATQQGGTSVASAVTATPHGTNSGTTVQAQLDELADEKVDAANAVALSNATPLPPATTATAGSGNGARRYDAQPPSYGLFGWLGDGSDGAATFDGTATPAGVTKVSSTLYALTRDVHYTTMAQSAGVTVDTAGFILHVRETLAGPTSGTATITAEVTPVSGTNNSVVPVGSPNYRRTARTISLGSGYSGKAGGTGAGSAVVPANAGWPTLSVALNKNCGTGGSGSGGAGGAAYVWAVNGSGSAVNVYRRFHSAISGWTTLSDGAVVSLPSANGVALLQGGVGGSSGGGDGTNAGGAGGGGGNIVIVNAQKVTGNVNVTAPGGDGGTPTTGNCGGGGGGVGGYVRLNSCDLTGWTGSVSAAGGAGGAGVGTGTAGGAGAAGIALATQWL